MSVQRYPDSAKRAPAASRWVAVAALAVLMGCSSNNQGKIEGTKWACDKAEVRGHPVAAGSLSLEFGSDGSLAYRVRDKSYPGTYSLGWGNIVTLKFDRELAGRQNHTEKIVVEGDSLTMTDSDGTKIAFSKAK